MLIISYDISDDKLRTRFSKYLSKHGSRLQYSVFEIKNSERILGNIVTTIKCDFEKLFSERDSVYIFELSGYCKKIKFGYAKHEDENVTFVD